MLISWPYYGTRFFSMTCSCFTCRIVHIFTHVCCLNWLYPDSLSLRQPSIHDCFIYVYIVLRELRCNVFRDKLGRISGFTSSICAHVLLVVLLIPQLLFIIFIICLSFLSDPPPFILYLLMFRTWIQVWVLWYDCVSPASLPWSLSRVCSSLRTYRVQLSVLYLWLCLYCHMLCYS
jgi:hypothetical protein